MPRNRLEHATDGDILAEMDEVEQEWERLRIEAMTLECIKVATANEWHALNRCLKNQRRYLGDYNDRRKP